MIPEVKAGESRLLTTTFLLDDVATDPDTVTLALEKDGEAVTVGDLINPSAGVWEYRFTPEVGKYAWTWTGHTDPDTDWVDDGGFTARPVLTAQHPETILSLQRLYVMTNAGGDPSLSEDELRMLLAQNVRPDGTGREPANAEWEPRYALGGAAADGWLIKAGKAADRVTGSDGSISLQRSDLHAHCLEMADRYGRRRISSIILAGSGSAADLSLLPVFNSDAIPVPDEARDRGGALR